MRKIVAKFIVEMNELLAEKRIKVRVSESATDELITKGYDAKMGARPLAKTINDLIKVPVSKKILFEGLADGSVINVDFQDGQFVFDVVAYVAAELPSVDLNGYIRLD